MFVRKKKNRSGTTSVVVVDKRGGGFKELHTIGVSDSADEIERLVSNGRKWIDEHIGVQRIDFDDADLKADELLNAEKFLDQVDSVLLNGAKLMLCILEKFVSCVKDYSVYVARKVP